MQARLDQCEEGVKNRMARQPNTGPTEGLASARTQIEKGGRATLGLGHQHTGKCNNKQLQSKGKQHCSKQVRYLRRPNNRVNPQVKELKEPGQGEEALLFLGPRSASGYAVAPTRHQLCGWPLFPTGERQ